MPGIFIVAELETLDLRQYEPLRKRTWENRDKARRKLLMRSRERINNQLFCFKISYNKSGGKKNENT